MGPVPWEGADQVSPMLLNAPAHVSPVGCWVPALVSSISWEGRVSERPLFAAGTELLSDSPMDTMDTAGMR